MTAKPPSRGVKAAKTLKRKNKDHFVVIGAKGGAKTTGTFKTKRGLATSAGKRSGQVRRLKMFDRLITHDELEVRHLPEGSPEHEAARRRLELHRGEREILSAEIEGTYTPEAGFTYEK